MEIMLILAVGCFLYYYFVMKKAGNLPFWKLVNQHPEEAFRFISTNPHWHIGQKPTHRQVVGPFKMWNPDTGQRISAYCENEFIETTQKEFCEKMKGNEV